MQLNGLDWLIIIGYFLIALFVGVLFARRAGSGPEEFFVSGRSLPWWLLGTSMVATTFSTDTPNLVTDIVRRQGVFGNWVWWAFLITGMCTVFFYARLWRRSGVLTDIGFYELRYSGRPAAFLRGFRAIYLGLFFNVMIMATVTLAAIKISGVLLGLDPRSTVAVCGIITALYSATAGLWGVVVTDLLLFFLAMTGSLAAAYYALSQPEVGGLSGLLSHPQLQGRLNLLPDFADSTTLVSVFLIPIAVQWWSVWYPGAEPGGGGYVAQRMLAARDEKNALLATLWFNVAHYALRPWPWVLVALCSLVVFPSLDSLRQAFPHLDPSIVNHDMAYPAMLTFLPHGLLGLVLASLAAAYMSTISTHLNWGASYLVDDFYRRFVVADGTDPHYVMMARVCTVFLILMAGGLALWLESALQAFQILLQIGAGTGLIFLLRWFWWRVNPWSEISAMVCSFLVALHFQFGYQWLGWERMGPSLELLTGVGVTTIVWVTITFLTPPENHTTLRNFYQLIRPMGPGWGPFEIDRKGSFQKENLTASLLGWLLGVAGVYCALFGTGYFLYGRPVVASLLVLGCVLCFGPIFLLLARSGDQGLR